MIQQFLASASVACNGNLSCDTGLPLVKADNNNVQFVAQIVFGVIGSLAVIIIVISSLRLVASQGNPQEASKARQGIIYSAVGLLVAVSAEIIVTFVLGAI